MPVECRLHDELPMPEPALVARYAGLATSLVSDVTGRWAGAVGLLPVAGLAPGAVIAGPAFTVRTRPGDNLVVHKALDLVRPGEVVVVAAGGHRDRAIAGMLMVQYATERGVAAMVVDGVVRDRADLLRGSLPVFAAGFSHLGPYKDGPGELRGIVSVGGVAVQDGDLVVGDDDGIAVVPRDRAEEVADLAETKRGSEDAESRAIAEGRWDRSWIDATLDLRRVGARRG